MLSQAALSQVVLSQAVLSKGALSKVALNKAVLRKAAGTRTERRPASLVEMLLLCGHDVRIVAAVW